MKQTRIVLAIEPKEFSHSVETFLRSRGRDVVRLASSSELLNYDFSGSVVILDTNDDKEKMKVLLERIYDKVGRQSQLPLIAVSAIDPLTRTSQLESWMIGGYTALSASVNRRDKSVMRTLLEFIDRCKVADE